MDWTRKLIPVHAARELWGDDVTTVDAPLLERDAILNLPNNQWVDYSRNLELMFRSAREYGAESLVGINGIILTFAFEDPNKGMLFKLSL